MDLNTVVAKGDDFLANEIDGEVVMMNIETGSYVSLNSTGKSIWNLLDQPKTIDEIINSLIQEYNITKEQCENDLLPFIEQMLSQKIVVKN